MNNTVIDQRTDTLKSSEIDNQNLLDTQIASNSEVFCGYMEPEKAERFAQNEQKKNKKGEAKSLI